MVRAFFRDERRADEEKCVVEAKTKKIDDGPFVFSNFLKISLFLLLIRCRGELEQET